MSYAAFALSVGASSTSPTGRVSRIAFYYNIPEDYRHACVFCETPISPHAHTLLVVCAVSDLPWFVAQYPCSAAVAALLNEHPIVGAAHSHCLPPPYRSPIVDALDQATPYYRFATQMFPLDFYTHHGYVRTHGDRLVHTYVHRVYIRDTQRSMFLQRRRHWATHRALSPIDPPTWVQDTCIAAIAKSYRDHLPWFSSSYVPVWELTVPSPDPSVRAELIANMNYCTTWTTYEARTRFDGPLQCSARYPIIEYTNIGKSPIRK